MGPLLLPRPRDKYHAFKSPTNDTFFIKILIKIRPFATAGTVLIYIFLSMEWTNGPKQMYCNAIFPSSRSCCLWPHNSKGCCSATPSHLVQALKDQSILTGCHVYQKNTATNSMIKRKQTTFVVLRFCTYIIYIFAIYITAYMTFMIKMRLKVCVLQTMNDGWLLYINRTVQWIEKPEKKKKQKSECRNIYGGSEGNTRHTLHFHHTL